MGLMVLTYTSLTWRRPRPRSQVSNLLLLGCLLRKPTEDGLEGGLPHRVLPNTTGLLYRLEALKQ